MLRPARLYGARLGRFCNFDDVRKKLRIGLISAHRRVAGAYGIEPTPACRRSEPGPARGARVKQTTPSFPFVKLI